MIICGLLMDTMVLAVFTVFGLKGTTWRIVIALAIFQLTKFLCAVRLNLFLPKHPYIASILNADAR